MHSLLYDIELWRQFETGSKLREVDMYVGRFSRGVLRLEGT